MLLKKSTVRKVLWGILVLGALTIAILASRGRWKEAKISLPVIRNVPAFVFVDEDSMRITENAFMGKVTVVDFIFTQCAGICPLMSTKMAELEEDFRNDPRVQFVSFSVDPANDTPEVLRNYASAYGATKGKWKFVTGDKGAIYKLTQEGFLLGVDIDASDDAILHSNRFVLVDADGAIRGYYDSEEEAGMKNLARDARTLVAEVRR